MNRYLIETSHTAVECAFALKQIGATGYITHFDWGCKDGQHTGWAIIEAESENEVRNILPPYARQAAKVIKVTRFSRADIEGTH